MDIYNVAQNLEGRTIGVWKVLKKVEHEASTGGNFSVGYNVVSDSGVQGFLKAIDFSKEMPSPDRMQVLINSYIFERNLLNTCLDRHMRYVVRIVDHGVFRFPPEDVPNNMYAPYPDVYYMVMEQAEGSVRGVIDLSQSFDYAWALRSLHNVAVGLEEMHQAQIAHQDIKPSNVLLFNGQKISKVTDLGRSSTIGISAEHDEYFCAGDRTYSPFEQIYGFVNEDWRVRRFSCDMYMFGNLIAVYFNNVSMTIAVLNTLSQDFKVEELQGTYLEILPRLEFSFEKCLNHFNESIDSELRTELIKMVSQLCHPDIKKRGDLLNSNSPDKSQQYSLRRYISRLDYLTKKWEYKFRQVIR